MPWLHQTHHRLHQTHIWLHIKNQVRNCLHKNKHWIHEPKQMKDRLRAAVQRNFNKRCMLSSLSYVVMMRVIYYLSLVLYCDNPPRKIPYYRLNQSTLAIK
jgi:hypothetical protein